ncbi:cyanophycinase [Paraflavisolibacter sp. H34]|uniref:cyanophycinase n=1 Tax=Huijunlia imazamoxiresistens TaxID=3127457 RepID=UPI003017C97A
MTKNKGNSCPVPQGILMIIGGKENKGQEPEEKADSKDFERMEILKAFIGLMKKNKPVLEVITSASGEGTEAFREYRKLFEELGVPQIGHIHHGSRKEVGDPELVERIEKADGIFFTGGDQLLLTGLYGGSEFLSRLKQRYISHPIVIGGTSAGAMALSTPMIYAGTGADEKLGGEIHITTGLEFVKDVCIDTHFVNRGRFVRMAQVIVTNPTCIGLGIEEDTALVVRHGLEGEVIGSGIIIVIEGFHIGDSNLADFAAHKPVSIHNLKVHLIVKGEKYKIPQLNPPHI